MSVGKALAMMFVAVVLGVAVVGGCVYSGYNRAVALDEAVKNAWAQVDNQLQRRFELVPNLVETVKGFASQEKDVFLGVAKVRESYFQAKSPTEKAKAASAAEPEFASVLSRLLVLQEKYPELKSNESFLKLHDDLAGTENRLAHERMRYNEQVRELNTYSRKLLGRLCCSLAGVEQAEYYTPPEAAKTAPKVDFSTKPQGG